MKKYLFIIASMFIVSTALTGCKDDDDNGAGQPGITPAPASDVVDLGLPSGTLWASANLGATSSTETGNLYAWSEAYTKGSFSQSNYFDPSNTTVTSNIIGSGYDAAKAALGGEWQMPTKAQFKELFDNCKATRITKTEVKDGKNVTTVIGIKFVGPNEKELYLPAVVSSVAGGSSVLYDSYENEKSQTVYQKYANVYANYWTGEISNGISNSNQYAVQAMYVEHAKDAVKAGAEQYGGVFYNRSRFVGAPIRPVKATGGAPISSYVDIKGTWAESDASGAVKPLSESPFFMSYEGTNYTGKAVLIEYGKSIASVTYSRDVNKLTIDDNGTKSSATVAYVTAPNPDDANVVPVISLTDESGVIKYFAQAPETSAVPSLSGKWDFTYKGEAMTLNFIDGANCQVIKGSEKIATNYLYRFGTIGIETTIFAETYAVEATGSAAAPFQFKNESGTITFTEHPKSYMAVFSWTGVTETTAPSIMTLNSNNTLVDAATIKQDMLSLDGASYGHAVRLNKSVNSGDIGTESADAANISTLAVLVSHNFKTGDRIRIRGYVNGADKNGSFKVFTTSGIYLGAGAPNVTNYADGTRTVGESIFTFTQNVNNVYISRQAGTGTFICEFYIDNETDD